MWLHTPTLGRNSECLVKAFRFCLVSAFSVLRRDGTWWWHMMTRSTGNRENYCFALSVLQPCFRWLEAWQPGADRPRALEAFGLWPLYPCGFWGREAWNLKLEIFQARWSLGEWSLSAFQPLQEYIQQIDYDSTYQGVPFQEKPGTGPALTARRNFSGWNSPSNSATTTTTTTSTSTWDRIGTKHECNFFFKSSVCRVCRAWFKRPQGHRSGGLDLVRSWWVAHRLWNSPVHGTRALPRTFASMKGYTDLQTDLYRSIHRFYRDRTNMYKRCRKDVESTAFVFWSFDQFNWCLPSDGLIGHRRPRRCFLGGPVLHQTFGLWV